jgi:pathogenesis-related protein 1
MSFPALICSVNFILLGLISLNHNNNLGVTHPILTIQMSWPNLYLAKTTLHSNLIQKKKKKGNSETTVIFDKSPDTTTKDNSAIGSRLSSAEIEKILTLHNKVRADVGVAQLIWSADLAIYAQEWADNLVATNCDLEHRPRSGKWEQKYGENLFMGGSGYYDVTSAVKYWEEEKRHYNGQAIDNNNQNRSSHYTQLVWGKTKQIGCAKVVCKANIIVVCNYDPPGNMLGQKPY